MRQELYWYIPPSFLRKCKVLLLYPKTLMPVDQVYWKMPDFCPYCGIRPGIYVRTCRLFAAINWHKTHLYQTELGGNPKQQISSRKKIQLCFLPSSFWDLLCNFQLFISDLLYFYLSYIKTFLLLDNRIKSPERKIQEQPHLCGLLQPAIKTCIPLLCEQCASVGGIK